LCSFDQLSSVEESIDLKRWLILQELDPRTHRGSKEKGREKDGVKWVISHKDESKKEKKIRFI
jgi:hypothetical protein